MFNSQLRINGSETVLGLRGCDPRCLPAFSEFMVEEHELRKEKIQEDYNDRYWDQRYTVVQRQIPSFLQKMAGKVLSTGDARGGGGGTAGLRRGPILPGVLSVL